LRAKGGPDIDAMSGAPPTHLRGLGPGQQQVQRRQVLGLVGAAQAESDCSGPRAGSPCAQAGPADADSPLQAAAAPRNPG
jgi:hypothetical protein